MKKFTLTFLILLSNLSFSQGNGLYKFKAEDGKYGFMNKEGKIKVKPAFLIVNDFNDGLSFVSKEVITKGYKWICIDTIGNQVFDIKDNFPETEFNQGYARISSFTEHWFINKKGEKVFTKTFQDGRGGFENGYAKVSDEEFKNFYFIDLNGTRVENPKIVKEFSEAEPTSELESFKQNGKFGFKDKDGKVVIEPKFFKVDKFVNGLCGVRINEVIFETANDYFLDAIINEKGEILNQLEMHCFMGFQGDLVEFYGGPHFTGGVFYINKDGKLVSPIK